MLLLNQALSCHDRQEKENIHRTRSSFSSRSGYHARQFDSTNYDIKMPDLGIVFTREEQMTRIMRVQLEKLEKITSDINLLRSGFGHVDTKVDKVQAELTMLQARRGNDAS